MGHYASEMACVKCGVAGFCRCYSKREDDSNKWLVTKDLSVMLVSTFDEKHRYIQTRFGKIPENNPWVHRGQAKLFDTKDEALAYRFVLADLYIELAQRALFNAELDLQRAIQKKAELV